MKQSTGFDIHYLPEGIFEVRSAAHKDLVVKDSNISAAIDRLLVLISESTAAA